MADEAPEGIIVADDSDAEEQAKEWAVKLDGRDPVHINDLPMVVTRDIAKKHGVVWAMVGEVPNGLAATEPDAAIDLVKAAAAHVGIDAPQIPTSHGEVIRFLADRFVQVDSNLPTAYRDGLPLTDAQTTT